MLRITGGKVYDPANNINGVVKDICIDDGTHRRRRRRRPHHRRDRHGRLPRRRRYSHARRRRRAQLRAGHDAGESARGARSSCTRRATRAGIGGPTPTTFATGYLYAGMGYTTVVEAAVPVLSAKHTHEELRDTPIVDKACCVLMANNEIVLDLLEAGELRAGQACRRLADLGGQGLRRQGGQPRRRHRLEMGQGRQAASRAGRRLQQGRRRPRSSPAWRRSSIELGLPHPLHLHCNNLGAPGNVATTLETMKVLEGNRAHMAHLQFHAYGGDDWHTMRSEAAADRRLLQRAPNLTCDAGAVLFGNAVTITADGPWQHLLYQLTGRKWGNLDVENETGCGIVPYTYKGSNLVNAVQWAVGLELLLLIDDPVANLLDHRPSQRRLLLALSRDHPPADERRLPQGARQGAAGQGAEAHRPGRPGPAILALRDRHHHLGGPGAGPGPDAERATWASAPMRTWPSTTRTRTAS